MRGEFEEFAGRFLCCGDQVDGLQKVVFAGAGGAGNCEDVVEDNVLEFGNLQVASGCRSTS